MTHFDLTNGLFHVCCWCNHLMDENAQPVRRAPATHTTMEGVSHGICRPCYLKERERLNAIWAERQRQNEAAAQSGNLASGNAIQPRTATISASSTKETGER